MPAATTQAEKLEREARAKVLLNEALKAHVKKERQRKKEEHEAEVEEERLRKEREARQRQDVMTLGETREQISKLEQKLNDLKNEKQSLFLQLKKVLNEDENRKKQQQQKDSELFAQMHPAPHPQVFLPPRQQNIVKTGGIKRGRSPSPPPGQQTAYYKGSQYSPKIDDGRRGPDVSRVLWKQPPGQYQNPPGTLFYQTTANPPTQDSRPQPIIYPAYTPMPLRQAYLDIPTQAALQHGQQKIIDAQIQSNSQSHGHKPQVTMEKIPDRYHVEVKIEPPGPPQSENVVYAPLIHPNMLQQVNYYYDPYSSSKIKK